MEKLAKKLLPFMVMTLGATILLCLCLSLGSCSRKPFYNNMAEYMNEKQYNQYNKKRSNHLSECDEREK